MGFSTVDARTSQLRTSSVLRRLTVPYKYNTRCGTPICRHFLQNVLAEYVLLFAEILISLYLSPYTYRLGLLNLCIWTTFLLRHCSLILLLIKYMYTNYQLLERWDSYIHSLDPSFLILVVFSSSLVVCLCLCVFLVFVVNFLSSLC